MKTPTWTGDYAIMKVRLNGATELLSSAGLTLEESQEALKHYRSIYGDLAQIRKVR